MKHSVKDMMRYWIYFCACIFSVVLISVYILYLFVNGSFGRIDLILVLLFAVLVWGTWHVWKLQNSYYNMKYTDPLTGGLNEKQFSEAFKEKIKDTEQKYAFMYVNIKKFSLINSQFGFDVGNDVLKKVYAAMKSTISDDELICRNHADTFYLLIKIKDFDDLFSRVYQLDDSVYFLKDLKVKRKLFLSIGLYMINKPDENFMHVVECANYARNASLDARDDNTHFEVYAVSLKDNRVRERKLEEMARPALERHDFKLYLQPKYELEHESLAEAEALIRWIDKDEGMVPLYEFIPVFERNGFIRQIDYFIFEETLKLIQKWLDEGVEPIKISVNLSKSHFTEEKFFQKSFMPIFNRYNVPKRYVEFEISESTVLDHEGRLTQFVKSLREQGFDCSMDDFGSGYSSLNTLKSLPVSVIKLDRKMFSEEEKERGKIVSQGIVKIAKEMDMNVVAEGVETREYVDFLKSVGCDMIQGYYFGKPMNVEEFEEVMKRDRLK